MKLWQRIVAIIVCVCMLGGCTYLVIAGLFGNKGVEIEIQVNTNFVSCYDNETFNALEKFGIKVLPENLSLTPVFSSSDTDIAKVGTTTGDIECLKTGFITIYCAVRYNDKTTTKNLYLNITEAPKYPENISIANESVIVKQNKTITNILTITGEYNQEVKVSYKNNLVSYDYKTGKLTAKNEIGTDEITIKVKKNSTEYFTVKFNVSVVEDIVEEVRLKVNEQKQITYFIDSGCDFSLYNNFEVKDETICSVLSYDYPKLLIKGLTVGETKLIFGPQDDLRVYKIIVEEDN